MSKPPPPLKEWSKNNLVREVERLRAILHEHASSPADPASSGGELVDVAGDPYGRGTVVLDTRDAVLMETIDVSLVDTRPGSGEPPAMALLLAGRVNLTERRTRQMFLFGTDGAAGLVSELVGLAARAGGEFATRFQAELDQRMKEMP